MKVPNKVLNIVLKLVNAPDDVTDEERSVVITWAREGQEKRAALVKSQEAANED